MVDTDTESTYDLDKESIISTKRQRAAGRRKIIIGSVLLLFILGIIASGFVIPLIQRIRAKEEVEDEKKETRTFPVMLNLDNATLKGQSDGKVDYYLGVRYAESTGGDNRFRLPVAVGPYSGDIDATDFGPACPQQNAIEAGDISSKLTGQASEILQELFFKVAFPSSEDCLSVNVYLPSNMPSNSTLPVVAWIFGGGFELGASGMYPGNLVIERSVELNEPLIFVSMNYRISVWGFLASKEVRDAKVGNLGLQDQRLALRWIQKYISAFGGDPSRVTLWGESAGAISASLHMLTNNGDTDGLFRGAFMQSGAPTPVGDITNGQPDYDEIVQQAGCGGSNDTLACLRTVPQDVLQEIVNNGTSIFSFRSLNLQWQPRVDGVFFTDNPQNLVRNGSVAPIPFVSGNNDDEGTLFSLIQTNITTDQDLQNYLISTYLPRANASASADVIQSVSNFYPSDVTQGSPFDTGELFAMTPQFKRLAAVQGDLAFQAPRRFFMTQRSGKQSMYGFLNKRLKLLPFLGATHATDLVQTFFSGELQDALIHFVNHLDPNGEGVPEWPKYTAEQPTMLMLMDGKIVTGLTNDTYRQEGINAIQELSTQFPL